MIASLRTPVSGSRVMVTPEPRYRPASPSEWIGIGSFVMSASAPRSFTSLQGPSATIFEPPGTRVNMRSESSRTTFCGVVPSALAWRARSFTRMSQSFQPGKPLRRLSTIGRGAAEQSAPAWVIGSTSSSTRIRSSPSAARKSLRLSAIVVSSAALLRLLRAAGRLQGHVVADDQEYYLAVRGLVPPGLQGPELGDVVGLAEHPLELGALGYVARLRDDLFLRPSATRHQAEHDQPAHKHSRRGPRHPLTSFILSCALAGGAFRVARLGPGGPSPRAALRLALRHATDLQRTPPRVAVRRRTLRQTTGVRP